MKTDTIMLAGLGLGALYLLSRPKSPDAGGSTIPFTLPQVSVPSLPDILNLTLPGSPGGGGFSMPSFIPMPQSAPVSEGGGIDNTLEGLTGLIKALGGFVGETGETIIDTGTSLVTDITEGGEGVKQAWWKSQADTSAAKEQAELAELAAGEAEALNILQQEANTDEIAEYNLEVDAYNEELEEIMETEVRQDYEDTLQEQGLLMAIPFVREVSSWFFWLFTGEKTLEPLFKTPLPTQEEED